jgi:hypothetical protein
MVTGHAMFVGRVVFQKSATSGFIAESAFTTVFTASTGVTDHGSLSGLGDNDHPQYQLVSEKGSASGYCGLDGSLKVALTNLYSSTETVSGISEIATQAETNTGTDDNVQITPLKLANSTTVYHPAGTDVSIADGGTGQSTATLGFNALSPLTTKGDLIIRDSTNNTRLPVGTNGQVISANSALTLGVEWLTLTASSVGAAPTSRILTINGTPFDLSADRTWTVGDMLLAGIQSVTGAKTFDKDKILMKGTSTGVTTLSTANTSATNYTATLQAATGTIAYLSDVTVSNVNTTKGDLHTYSTTQDRLPVGTNGQFLVANSAASTGLQWQTKTYQAYFTFHNTTVLNNYMTDATTTSGSTNISLAIPTNAASIVKVEILGYVAAGAAGTAKNIDFSVQAGDVGQAFNTHTASDTTSTYNLTGYTNQLYSFNITALFSTVVAGNNVGILISHNAIGGNINYIHAVVHYTV